MPNKPKLIVLTGPESTAKSTLSNQLANHFGGLAFPEYAREYLEQKDSAGNYTYQDVERIAKGQLMQYQQAASANTPYVFLDTWLIVTKVWFDWVYQTKPSWLEQAINEMPIDLYLLCAPDIAWQDDPLRENGGQTRVQLYHQYEQELIARGLLWRGVKGDGEARLQNAIVQLEEALKDH